MMSPMEVSFVAGFGAIVRDVDPSRGFWAGLGIELEESAPSSWASDNLDGAKASPWMHRPGGGEADR
jgi:hypothetical protein